MLRSKTLALALALAALSFPAANSTPSLAQRKRSNQPDDVPPSPMGIKNNMARDEARRARKMQIRRNSGRK